MCKEIVRDLLTLSPREIGADLALRSDNPLTFTRRSPDTRERNPRESMRMTMDPLVHARKSRRGLALLMAFAIYSAGIAVAQYAPYISGGGGFITSTRGGNTTYIPVIAPELVSSLGDHLLVETRATLLESFFPRGGGEPGYKHDAFLGLTFLQADVIASRHLTVVGGDFLTPFGTYNERLTPIWISNFEEAPLIYSIGNMGTGSSVGGMVRGSAYSDSAVNIDYAAYYSAASTNKQFDAERSTGARLSLYFKHPKLETGASFGRLLQDTHENYSGFHLWWEPDDSHLRFRSEFAHAPHAFGYWLEADYEVAQFGNEQGFLSRFEPIFRMQQTFRSAPDSEDGLPSADTRQVDFGLDYRLPHEVRINTSYSREFSSTGNRNIWQTGIVYRFLIPLWREK